ncbi:hypothetical protein LTR12_007866 [Friedmanniomyces endolithicus]|nr:hypothetical protein LTR12_007866 [Friedmanniomyces endolithicus]
MERIRKRKEAAISTRISKAMKKHNSQPNVVPPGQELQSQARRFWDNYPQQLLPNRHHPRSTIAGRVKPDGTSVQNAIKPGQWPVEFCQALLDFAEQEHVWRVAYGYMEAQYSLRRDEEGPNGDKSGVEGFMTEDVVEALVEWRREKEEEVRAAALAEEEERGDVSAEQAAAPAAVVVPVAVMY